MKTKTEYFNVLTIQSIVQQNDKLVGITLYFSRDTFCKERKKNERENQSRVIKIKYLSAQAYH